TSFASDTTGSISTSVLENARRRACARSSTYAKNTSCCQNARSRLASRSYALGSGRPRRVHVRAGLAAGWHPLRDDVRAKDPFAVERAVYGNGFFVILSQINLHLLKFAFSPRACQAQQRVRIIQELESIRALVHNNFSGEHFGFALQLGRLLLGRSTRLFQHLFAQRATGQNKQTEGQQNAGDRFHSPLSIF